MDRQCTRCPRIVNVSDYPLEEPYVCVPCKNAEQDALCVHDFEVYDFARRAKCRKCMLDITVDEMRKMQGLPPLPVVKLDDAVDHPKHYGGAEDPYEAIKVMEAWHGPEPVYWFCLLSAEKYLSRMGKKPGEPMLRDLKKAAWYLEYAAKMSEKVETRDPFDTKHWTYADGIESVMSDLENFANGDEPADETDSWVSHMRKLLDRIVERRKST